MDGWLFSRYQLAKWAPSTLGFLDPALEKLPWNRRAKDVDPLLAAARRADATSEPPARPTSKRSKSGEDKKKKKSSKDKKKSSRASKRWACMRSSAPRLT